MRKLFLFLLLLTSASFAQAATKAFPLINDYIENCKSNLTENREIRRFSGAGTASDFVYYDRATDQLGVEIHLHFRLESFHSFGNDGPETIPQIILESLSVVSNFYAQFGLSLNISATFDLSMAYQPEPVPPNAHLIYLRPYRGDTMNILRWGINKDWDVQRRAMIYAHELTHLFDILDEYERKTLFAGFIGEEDSLMRNWDHPNVRLYPRHIQQILSPLCGD